MTKETAEAVTDMVQKRRAHAPQDVAGRPLSIPDINPPRIDFPRHRHSEPPRAASMARSFCCSECMSVCAAGGATGSNWVAAVRTRTRDVTDEIRIPAPHGMSSFGWLSFKLLGIPDIFPTAGELCIEIRSRCSLPAKILERTGPKIGCFLALPEYFGLSGCRSWDLRYTPRSRWIGSRRGGSLPFQDR